MNDLHTLLLTTIRLFYTNKQAALVSLLSKQTSEEDLIFLMRLNQHEVRKALGPLLRDKIVKSTSVMNVGIRTTYKISYYIDYKSTYNCIKYKIMKIQALLRKRSEEEKNVREYKCRRCEMKFNQIQVTNYLHNGMFRCPYHTEDIYLELEDEDSISYIKLMEFNDVVAQLMVMLKKNESIKQEEIVKEEVISVDITKQDTTEEKKIVNIMPEWYSNSAIKREREEESDDEFEEV